MPKRKHTNKKPLIIRADANESTIKSMNEKKRLAAARQKRIEKFKAEYEAKMKEMAEKKAESEKKEEVAEQENQETLDKPDGGD